MSSLSKLLSDRLITNQLIEMAQGEISQDQEVALSQLEKDLATKPDAIAAVLEDFEAAETILAKRATDIAAARKALKAQYERLEKYTVDNMLHHDLRQLEGSEVVLKISPTAGSLEITDQTLAEQLYGETKTEIVVSKDRIKADLKNSVDLGVGVIKQNWSLKIKTKRSK